MPETTRVRVSLTGRLADPYPALPAPSGPGAARRIAARHLAAGRHVHLIAEGETNCLGEICATPTLTGV